jgi:hypothetical protein
MSREGSRVPFIKFDGIRLSEAKKLMSPGTSLASLAAACGLEAKGSFPFDLFTSLDFLKEKQLPPLAKDWTSRLNPSKNLTQAEVDACLEVFADNQCASVKDYLQIYLRKDCDLLLQGLAVLHQNYFDVMGLSFVQSARFTVSALASAAALSYLTRVKSVGVYSLNHARIYAASIYLFSLFF